MTGPQVVNKQSIHQVSPDNWYKNSKGETSVKVGNLSCVIFINEEAISVTQFKGGQSIQRLLVYGDGFTTLVHSSSLVLANNENKLLEADSLYEFAYVNGAWRELSSLSSGGGGGGGIITQFSHIAGDYISGDSFNGSVAVTWSVSATPNNEPNTIVARDVNGDFSANIINARIAALNVMPGSFALGNYRIPNNLTIGDDLLVQTSGLVLGGFNSLGSGTDSTRIGPDADATGLNGIAIGDTALASTGIRIGAGGPTANGALIIGQNPSVTGTQTTFRNSLISIGHNNVQNDAAGVATGFGNIILGNNFPGVDHSPLLQSTIAIGHDIVAIGRDNIVVGHGAQISTTNDVSGITAIGNSNFVASVNSTVIGGGNSLTLTPAKIIVGMNNASAFNSIIFGNGITASKNGQVFIGSNSSFQMSEFWFGRGESASFANIVDTASEPRYIKFTNRTTATNAKAGDIYFDAPLGTGVAEASSFIFRVAASAVGATTPQTYAESFRIVRGGIKLNGQFEAEGTFYLPTGLILEGDDEGELLDVQIESHFKKDIILGVAPGVLEKSVLTSSIRIAITGDLDTGYTLTQTSNNFNWLEQAYSLTGYIGNSTTPAKVSAKLGTSAFTSLVFGLATNPTASPSYTTIEYAFFFDFGTLRIYESGVLVGSFGSVGGSGVNTYTIEYDGTNVIYKRDGAVLRSVAAAAGLLLYFDSSFNRSGSVLTAVSFSGPDLNGAKITFEGLLESNITPDITNLYDLGSTLLRFKDGWFDGTVTADIFDADTQYNVASTKVIGAQQAAIADAIGGTEIATINAILAAMRTHGLIAT